jgi:2-polyprenyl-3-methyl-5-hydroxy-6-metoxy-1,4-benzoquinol methylase
MNKKIMTKLYFILKRLRDEHLHKFIQFLKPSELKTPKMVEAGSRTVEYPFVFKNLIELQKGRVLDVGCSGVNLPTELASLGFEVYGVDARKYLVKYPSVFFVQGDIRKSPLQNDCFDIVTAISTIEHIGTKEYGNILEDYESDKKAMREVWRRLKPEGVLLLTVPYGKSASTRKTRFRIYNNRSLNQLIEGFRIEKIEYYAKTERYWVPVSRRKAETTITTKGSRAVVLIALRKVCEEQA